MVTAVQNLLRPLLTDQKIGVFNPSDVLNDLRHRAVDNSLSSLSKIGFPSIKGKSLALAEINFTHHSIITRANDISNFLLNAEVGMLLAAWGGKGSNQILNSIPYNDASNARKPILGFSDTTVLLNMISEKSNIITFLGPNIAGKLNESEYGDLRQFRPNFVWKRFSVFGDADVTVVSDGTATGQLFGGNLKCYCLGLLLSGFKSTKQDGGIFIVEDTTSRPSEIEQIFVSLRQSGFLGQLGGLIFSPATVNKRPTEVQRRMSIVDVLARTTQGLNIPVLTINTFGHGKRKNPALPIGATVTLSSNKRALIVNDSIWESGFVTV